jgi:hypothetical protein
MPARTERRAIVLSGYAAASGDAVSATFTWAPNVHGGPLDSLGAFDDGRGL